MNEALPQPPVSPLALAAAAVRLPPTDLPYDDGVPLESNWHRLAMNLLIESIGYYWRDRDDFFVGGNMFLYFSLQRARNQDFRGPDFFVVRGVERHRERFYWATWDEDGKAPNVIIELTSPTTAHEDHTTKKDVYEQTLRTPEYYTYDPYAEVLEGWRLGRVARYEPIPANERGWLWSEQLGLWLGKCQSSYLEVPGIYLRFFDPEGNMVLIGREDQTRRAVAAQEQAEASRQQAEAEKQRAEAEKQRAEAAEAELARLKARLAELQAKQPPPP